jgi:hypothetical protein
MKITLQDVQSMHDFQQPLNLYTMGKSGKPEEREQKAFVECLMCEFPIELGYNEDLGIFSALIVATSDFSSGAKKTFNHKTQKWQWNNYAPSKQMQKYRKMGYQSGTPDVTILCPVGEYHGFVCEMKAGRNKETEEQKVTLAYLESQGYFVKAAWGFAEALYWWLKYLNK